MSSWRRRSNRAVAWERGRVRPDGQVDVAGNTRTGLGQEQWMGHNKGVNLSEITLCLLYHYARTARRNPGGRAANRGTPAKMTVPRR